MPCLLPLALAGGRREGVSSLNTCLCQVHHGPGGASGGDDRCVPQPDGLNWQVFSSCRCAAQVEGWARRDELESLLAEVILAYLGR